MTITVFGSRTKSLFVIVNYSLGLSFILFIATIITYSFANSNLLIFLMFGFLLCVITASICTFLSSITKETATIELNEIDVLILNTNNKSGDKLSRRGSYIISDNREFEISRNDAELLRELITNIDYKKPTSFIYEHPADAFKGLLNALLNIGPF
ncbi:hypothetical protein EOD41_08095 [Mucilaginibacter limnophilus]|uniref:Uncharacterized protein n=1 Tax=Mucilaginibacter limnophilus TaxID=1932778 RepID=A0A3S2UQD4_9SPHI|nr:hypothetical protein [Mucilaginibacter limnophilus]RVU01906.1 hypothetical protein EOD41_08095 [Mucilaginibacter limnophilus]